MGERFAPVGIYQHDPHAAPDSAFEPGRLEHLVPGNRARLLDARRTPVTVQSLNDRDGMFAVVVGAFEDAGARWELPLEDVSGFQFELGSPLLQPDQRVELERLVAHFEGTTEIPVTAEALARTARELRVERSRVGQRLAAWSELRELDLAASAAERAGSPAAIEALESLMEERELGSLERAFAGAYVSNPHAGEMVKGHAIVLAEMGLCRYSGRIARNRELFAGDGTRERRRAHVLLRLAFLGELLALLGRASVELYRGLDSERALEPSRGASLVGATFSREVAMSHFEGGPTTTVAMLLRQQVPASRLFMTFLETRAMSGRYREAEAVLIGDPANLAF
jgi:hypothetical protein